MTRRALVLLAPALLAAQSTPQDLEAEFSRLYNEFVADLNMLMAGRIRGKWDVRVARDVEKDFQKLLDHPGWVRGKGR